MSDTVVKILDYVLQAFSIAIIIRALLSWFDPGFRSTFGRVIHDLTEPIVGPIRKVLPTMGMFDLSTIVAIVLLQVLKNLLHSSFG